MDKFIEEAKKEFEERPFYIMAYERNEENGKEEGVLKHLELFDDVWQFIEQKLKDAERKGITKLIESFTDDLDNATIFKNATTAFGLHYARTMAHNLLSQLEEGK
jgi:hypothetical protein